MSEITEVPRTFVVGGESFTEAEIQSLKALFPVLDMVTLPKISIRRNPPVQKALLAGICLVRSELAQGPDAILNLTQTGRSLLGKV